MTSIGSYGSSAYSQISSLFSQLDKDSSGKVSEEEFSLATSSSLSSSEASSLFEAINDGEDFSAEDLSSLFQQMATLLQAQEQGGSVPPSGGGEDLFSKLDSDSDGTVTREEFVAGRPEEMSEEEADSLFSTLAGEDSDSVTQDEFAAMMPPPPPQGGMGGAQGGGSSAEETFDALDTDKDGTVSLQEYLAARPNDVSEEDATTLFQQIAGDAESFTLEDLKESQANGTMPPPKPSEGEGQDAFEEMLAALSSTATDESSATDSATTTRKANELQYLLNAIQAYTTAKGDGTQSTLGSLLAQAA